MQQVPRATSRKRFVPFSRETQRIARINAAQRTFFRVWMRGSSGDPRAAG